MPTLELTPEIIGPERTRLTLAYIQGVMLWPDDEESRRRLMTACYANEFRYLIRRLAKLDPSPNSVRITVLAEVSDLLAASPRLSDLAADRKRRAMHGTIAGQILLDTLFDHHRGSKRGLGAIKQDISQRFARSKNFKGLSISNINNTVWRTFWPVAHLWSAHFVRQHNLVIDGQPTSSPSWLDDLPHFLAVAEQLRRDGETCHPRRSDQPILDPVKTWKAPSSLDLREFRILYS